VCVHSGTGARSPTHTIGGREQRVQNVHVCTLDDRMCTSHAVDRLLRFLHVRTHARVTHPASALRTAVEGWTTIDQRRHIDRDAVDHPRALVAGPVASSLRRTTIDHLFRRPETVETIVSSSKRPRDATRLGPL
jgi:hypothetical protein